MKKAVVLPIVAAVSGALLGCGGGGGGGTPAPEPTIYTISFVKLERDLDSNIPSTCAIYGEYEQPTLVGDFLSALDAEQEKTYVYGVVADTGFNILIHDQDGNITDKTSFKPDTKGQIQLNMNNVPTGGYLTIEEESGTTVGDLQVHSVSVHRDMLQNMTIAVRNTQSSSNVCISGTADDRFRTTNIDETAATDIVTVDETRGYLASSSRLGENTVHSNSGTEVKVTSNKPSDQKVLVTAYSLSEQSTDMPTTSSKLTGMNGYAFVESKDIYFDGEAGSTNPTRLAVIDKPIVDMSINGLSSLDGGQVTVLHNGDFYTWQHIYQDSVSYSFSEDSSMSKWVADVTGVTSKGWTYNGLIELDGDVVSTTIPVQGDKSALLVGTCDASAFGYCFEQGQFDSSYKFARYQVRTKTSNDRSFTQTIYGVANTEQPLMEPSRSGLQIAINPSTDVYEASLMSSSTVTSQSKLFFMASHADYEKMTDLYDMQGDEFTDYNGVMPLYSTGKQLYTSLMDNTLTLIQARN